MNVSTAEGNGSGTWAAVVQRWRRLAWLVLLIADAGLLAWGAGAAAIPGHLPGPGGAPILPAALDDLLPASASRVGKGPRRPGMPTR